MKLTVAFLAALAAADARQAKRQYGYGGYPVNGGESSAVETPSTTPVPEIPTETENAYESLTSLPGFETGYVAPPEPSAPVTEEPETPIVSEVPEASEVPQSSYVDEVPADSTYVPEVPASTFPTYTPTEAYPEYPTGTGVNYPTGTGSVPEVPVSSYVPEVPEVPESSYVPEVPADSTYVPEVPESTFPTYTPTGVVPEYPTGTGAPGYPTGTGATPSVTEYITSVIYSTQTITSGSVIVTTSVPVGTTVCEKPTETPEASVYPPEGGEASSAPYSEVEHVSTATLTYTVGTGDNKHPVTTEIVTTSTETIYTTIYVTKAASTEVPAVYPTPGSPEGGYPSVVPEGYPVLPSGGAGEECAPPVTVTVTAQETVTVTAGEEYPEETPVETPIGEEQTPVVTPPSDYPTATPQPSAPYPIGNGTVPQYPTGSSGFLTSTKPYPTGPGSVPSGTGYPPAPEPSETSFVFPSGTEYPEIPSQSEYPEVPEVPEASTAESEYPTPTPEPGYPSYGGYRKRFGLF